MKTTITSASFVEAFRNYGRMDNFSREGLEILFKYFEQYEQDCGCEMELDVIGICCDFSESSIENIIQDYDIDVSEVDDVDEEDKLDIIQEIVLDYLNDHTSVVGVTSSGNVIYQNF